VEGGLTSPVCERSCSSNLEGLVYALVHPSYVHLYFRLVLRTSSPLTMMGGRPFLVSSSKSESDWVWVGSGLDARWRIRGAGSRTCFRLPRTVEDNRGDLDITVVER
jgi:hypothetical protein